MRSKPHLSDLALVLPVETITVHQQGTWGQSSETAEVGVKNSQGPL